MAHSLTFVTCQGKILNLRSRWINSSGTEAAREASGGYRRDYGIVDLLNSLLVGGNVVVCEWFNKEFDKPFCGRHSRRHHGGTLDQNFVLSVVEVEDEIVDVVLLLHDLGLDMEGELGAD